MIDEHDIIHLRFGLHHFSDRTGFAALQHDVHRVTVVIEGEDTRGVVVTCVLTEPTGVLCLGIQHAHVRDDGSVDMHNTRRFDGLDPLIEKSCLAFPTQGRVTTAADIQVALQHAVLYRARVLEHGGKTETRTHDLQTRRCRQQFHHRSRRNHLVRAMTVNHFTRCQILHQYGHVRLTRNRMTRQDVNR